MILLYVYKLMVFFFFFLNVNMNELMNYNKFVQFFIRPGTRSIFFFIPFPSLLEVKAIQKLNKIGHLDTRGMKRVS